VLDWGGTGRPVVLLAGLGGTAHAFDAFARKLTLTFHVYGITRRGYGASTAPEPFAENYTAERLGEDVVAVLDTLRIERPILIGHSFAGEELSFIGNRHPERVAGLVYLDAGGRFALSSPTAGDTLLDMAEARRLLKIVIDGVAENSLDDQEPISPEQQNQAIAELLKALPSVQKDLETTQAGVATLPAGSSGAAKIDRAKSRQGKIDLAVFTGQRRFTTLYCPALVIFPSPHQQPPNLTGAALARAEARDIETIESRASLFRAIPSVKVVLIPHATHAVFDSNQGDVLREILAFSATLP
jgi:non-heme chloroperoxidase